MSTVDCSGASQVNLPCQGAEIFFQAMEQHFDRLLALIEARFDAMAEQFHAIEGEIRFLKGQPQALLTNANGERIVEVRKNVRNGT